jgi:hypothetical protein
LTLICRRNGSAVFLKAARRYDNSKKTRQVLAVGSCSGFAFVRQGKPFTCARNDNLFDVPATNFTESTPLGNGRLGAMMFGGVNEERIVLNESSVWSGYRFCQFLQLACEELWARAFASGDAIRSNKLVPNASCFRFQQLSVENICVQRSSWRSENIP